MTKRGGKGQERKTHTDRVKEKYQQNGERTKTMNRNFKGDLYGGKGRRGAGEKEGSVGSLNWAEGDLKTISQSKIKKVLRGGTVT